jgi:multicomponent Na+:H+ antiporter subunit D
VSTIVVLPVALCLFAAGVSLAFHRVLLVQRLITVGVLGACVVNAIVLVTRVDDRGPVAVHLGAWPAQTGIVYVADMLSALLLLVSLVTTFAVAVYAIGQRGTDDRWSIFHPSLLALTAGVSASFLTADLFHLFVAFEVLLAASYVLLTLGGKRPQVRAGMSYTVINFAASLVLVSAIGLVYAATGTVNMAEASLRLAEVDPGLRQALVLLLLVVFGTKAAIFPLFFWLPDSYPTANSAVTAVFAGLLTKVGVYTIIRTQTLLDPQDGPSTLLLALAALTMVVGILGAVAQDDMKRILSFHIVSQIGYMLFGLALWSPAGIAAAIFFTFHQIPVKTALFLAAGMVEDAAGSSSIYRVHGMVRRMPVAAACFGVAAWSLAGLPPSSGFLGKLGLVQAGFAAEVWLITGVSLAVSLLTTFSMTKIWGGVFWGRDEAPALRRPLPVGAGVADDAASDEPVVRLKTPVLMSASTAGLVLFTVVVAFLGGPLMEWCQDAAASLLDPTAYLQVVLQR